MNELTVFNNEEFGEIRTMTIEGEPWFVVADICAYFGVSNRNRIMQSVDAEDKGGTQMDTPGGVQTVAIVNESGLYSVLFALQPNKARGVSKAYIEDRQEKLHRFKRWVTAEVLPAIRKTGGYVNDTAQFVESYFGQLEPSQKHALTMMFEESKRMSAQLKEQAPKVLFANAVETAHNSILIGDLAKIIRQNGVDIGQKRLFEWLRQNGYLIKDGQSKNMPTQKSMEMSLFEVKESTINNPDGSVRITRTTKVTGKGQTYFVKKFLS